MERKVSFSSPEQSPKQLTRRGTFSNSATEGGENSVLRSQSSFGTLVQADGPEGASVRSGSFFGGSVEFGSGTYMSLASERNYAQQFPMLYSKKKLVEDAFVHEMHSVMRGSVMLPICNFPDWVEVPHFETIFNISDQSVALIGGMLFALDEFLFDETSFVQTVVAKDVKCDLISKDPLAGMMSSDGQDEDMFSQATFGGGGNATNNGDDFHSTMEAAERQRRASARAGLGASPGLNISAGADFSSDKVTYRMAEYVSVTDEWVVQSFQQVTADGPKGKFFTRGFLVDGAAGIGGGAGSPKAGDLTKRNSMRNPVYGEDKLRRTNPKLLRWCLERDPFELGNAATIVKNLFHYFKYSWTVLRMVRSLMKAIRVMQRFCKKVVKAKRLAVRKVLREWQEQEKEKMLRLQAHECVPGDDIDAVVKQSLVKHYALTNNEKMEIIRQEWKRKRDLFRLQLQDTNFPEPYTWFVSTSEVIHLAEKRLFDRLTAGETSIFHHSKVQNLMAETSDQRKARKTLEMNVKSMNAAGSRR